MLRSKEREPSETAPPINKIHFPLPESASVIKANFEPHPNIHQISEWISGNRLKDDDPRTDEVVQLLIGNDKGAKIVRAVVKQGLSEQSGYLFKEVIAVKATLIGNISIITGRENPYYDELLKNPKVTLITSAVIAVLINKSVGISSPASTVLDNLRDRGNRGRGIVLPPGLRNMAITVQELNEAARELLQEAILRSNQAQLPL